MTGDAPGTGAHLVLIETSGNQAYIFATNKRAENVGASELTWRMGTQYALEAVAETCGSASLFSRNAGSLRANLLDKSKNPPIEDGGHAEVIVATSGKALLLVRTEAQARAIVGRVTRRALEAAPGIEVRGAVCPVRLGADSLPKTVLAVHEAVAGLRAEIPGPSLRFLRLPVVDECASSGLPASHPDLDDPDRQSVISEVSLKKRNARYDGRDRMRETLTRDQQPPFRLPEDIGETVEWVAVIHADGNGVGQILQGFGAHIGAGQPGEFRKYIDAMRRFSIALDIVAERAIRGALQEAYERQRKRGEGGDVLQAVPLVLGGDDLTLVCDGRIAVRLAADYLAGFEAGTADGAICGGILPAVAQSAFGVARLGACAGVAIVKPHFPFHLAYEMSEALAASAKAVKRNLRHCGKALPACALDFHTHYDASGADLGTLRRTHLLVDQGATNLIGRPYVVTPEDQLQDAGFGREWASAHHWDRLKAARDLFEGQSDLPPRSQIEVLRAALFRSYSAAEAELELIRHRYPSIGRILNTLCGHDADAADAALFRPEPWPLAGAPPADAVKCASGLLDLIDLMDFWR
ncbi:MAG: hypothetical protein ACREE4_05560 [Stellaceae bacterium]